MLYIIGVVKTIYNGIYGLVNVNDDSNKIYLDVLSYILPFINITLIMQIKKNFNCKEKCIYTIIDILYCIGYLALYLVMLRQ